jgi:large-conductance mechanosensitive channel
MRIAKPLLLIITPLGVAGGLYEAHRVAGGLFFMLAILFTLLSFGLFYVVRTIRRERAKEQRKTQT